MIVRSLDARVLLLAGATWLSACALDFGAFDPRGGAGSGGTTVTNTGSGGTSMSTSTTNGSGGGGTGGGGGDPAKCGTTDAFAEGFDAPPAPGILDYDPALRVNNELRLDLEAGDVETIKTVPWYEFREGQAVRVELVTAPQSGASAYLRFDMPNSGARLSFGVFDGELRLRLPNGVTLVLDTYDPVAHRWLQVTSLSGGILRAEVSANGDDFSMVAEGNLGTVPEPTFTQLALVGSSTTAAVVRFDNWRGSGAPNEACGSDTFVSDFAQYDQNAFGPFEPVSSGCTFTVDAQGVSVEGLGSPGSVCGLRSRHAFRAVESVVEVDVNTTVAGNHMALQYDVGIFVYAQFGYNSGLFRCITNTASVDSTVAFDPSFRWWKMRFTDDRAIGEVSSDGGASWIEACRAPYDHAGQPHRISVRAYSNMAHAPGVSLGTARRLGL